MNKSRHQQKRITSAVNMALLAMLPAIGSAADIATQELQTVTVVGEKFARPLDKTLTSVAVATAKDMEEHADGSLNDIMSRTPGIYTQSGFENWGIRGIPVGGFDEQGPATINGTVSVYVDGALQPHRMLTLNPMSLWDVEQVEVYRGPQSTVQGRNALAGSVVFQTKNPTFKPTLAVQGNVGNYGERGAAAVIGGTIAQGVVAGRLAVDVQEQDGYIRNHALSNDANPVRNENIRGKLLITPSDNLEILLTAAHTQNRRGIQSVNADEGRPRYYGVSLNTEESDRIEQDSLTAKLDYYLNDDWTLTSVTSNTAADHDSLLDFDENAVDEDEVVRDYKLKSFNQELRLGYKSPAVKAQVGVYYAKIKNDTNDRLDSGGDTLLRIEGNTDVANQAVFGEVNWDFVQNWQLIAGLRYDHERNRTRIDDIFGSDVFTTTESKSFNAFLPKLGVSYTFAPDQLAGFVVQRGYRGGGVNIKTLASHESYDPEYTTNYEFSYRGAWLNKTVRTTANLYYTKWKDQQVGILDPDDLIQVVNAGRSTMRGLELGVDYDVTKALRLSAGASYNDTEYKEFVNAGNDYSGLPFLFAPKKKFTLGGTYRFENQLTLNMDAVYQDSSASQYVFDGASLSETRRSDSVTLVNVNANYRFRGATIVAYVKNLFDKEYITNNQSDEKLDVGAPRTFGVAVRYDF